MLIARVDPFRDFLTIQNRLGRLFEAAEPAVTPPTRDWTPAVDVFETEEHDVVLRAELPGLSREAIDVTVDQKTLTIKGTRPLPENERGSQARRIEGSYGPFARTFSLPETVDASKVSAEYRQGVLTIRLPFKAESKPRAIAVEVAA